MALQILKEHLVGLSYPKIEEMDDDHVADVFSMENRTMFLQWVAEKMGYDDLPGTEPGLLLALAEIICCNGFCTRNEKQGFVTGTPELTVQDQLVIFQRILEYLSLLKRAESGEKQGTFTIDDLIAFREESVALFPGSKSRRRAARTDCSAKMQGYEGRLAEVETEIAALKGKAKLEAGEQEEVQGGVQGDLEAFKLAVAEFAKTVNILKVDRGDGEALAVEAPLGKCRELSQLYCQFSNNTEVIREFNGNDFPAVEMDTGISQVCINVEKAARMSTEALECKRKL